MKFLIIIISLCVILIGLMSFVSSEESVELAESGGATLDLTKRQADTFAWGLSGTPKLKTNKVKLQKAKKVKLQKTNKVKLEKGKKTKKPKKTRKPKLKKTTPSTAQKLIQTTSSNKNK